VAERPPQAWAMPFVLKSVGARSRAAVAASWRECQAELRETLALLRKAGDECSALALAAISPPADFPISRWTKDHAALVGAARAGVEAVHRAFGDPEAPRPALDARALETAL